VSNRRLEHLLDENTTVTVAVVAECLEVNEEQAAKVLRQARVPMFVRAGVLWANGKKPRRPTPTWLAMEKAGARG
jgi:hypothetical protein